MSHPWSYVAATLAVSWSAVGLFVLLGGQWNSVGSTIFAVGYMFVPLLVALVLARRDEQRRVREILGLHFSPNWWWMFAWLIPVLVALLAVGVGLLMPGVEFTTGVEGMIARYEHLMDAEQLEKMRQSVREMPVHPFWLGLAQGLVAGVSINALVAFGEEAGWRGYLYDAWRPLGFWRYSGLVGLVWGVWHAPLILLGHNYPDHPYIGVVMMIAFCLLYTPVITLARDRSGSVVAAAVLHGTINATFGLAILPLAGGSDLLVGVTGLAGLAVLAAVNLGLYGLRRLNPELDTPRELHRQTARDSE